MCYRSEGLRKIQIIDSLFFYSTVFWCDFFVSFYVIKLLKSMVSTRKIWPMLKPLSSSKVEETLSGSWWKEEKSHQQLLWVSFALSKKKNSGILLGPFLLSGLLQLKPRPFKFFLAFQSSVRNFELLHLSWLWFNQWSKRWKLAERLWKALKALNNNVLDDLDYLRNVIFILNWKSDLRFSFKE